MAYLFKVHLAMKENEGSNNFIKPPTPFSHTHFPRRHGVRQKSNPEHPYLGGHLDGLLLVGRHRVGAGDERADVGARRVEPEQVEVVLEHPVHEEGRLALPHGLVHEQLRLLGYVQLLVLQSGGEREKERH